MLLSDVGSYLQAQGIGTVNSTIFLGQQPSTPDQCITLYEYEGDEMARTWRGEFPKLQVRARSKSYTAGRGLLDSVIEELHGLGRTTMGSTVYLYMNALQSPQYLGQDKMERHEWAVNFRVVKER